MKIVEHYLTRQFLIFIGVGVVSVFLHWLARIVLSVWFSFSVAIFLSYFFGIIVAYELNKKFVFLDGKRSIVQFNKYFLINLLFLPIVLLVSITVRDLLFDAGVIYHIEKISHGVAVCIPPFATFLIYKLSIFKS